MNQQIKNYRAGAIGAVGGGFVFGIILHMIGMIPMIAKLVGSNSIIVGWIVHLLISVVIGLLFVWWFAARVHSYASGIEYGLLQGFILWILGPLVIMPIWLGMGVQLGNAFTKTSMMSLVGHLMFGLLLGTVYVAVTATQSKPMPQT